MDTANDVYITKLKNIIASYNNAADKFITKCNDGRARSKETLADLKACREAAKQIE